MSIHNMSRSERQNLQRWLADITSQTRKHMCAFMQAYTTVKNKLSQYRQDVDRHCL